MIGPQVAWLPDGRLHLNHGPIDLIVDETFRPFDFPEPVTATDLITAHPRLRAPIIHGLARRGETVNLIALADLAGAPEETRAELRMRFQLGDVVRFAPAAGGDAIAVREQALDHGCAQAAAAAGDDHVSHD